MTNNSTTHRVDTHDHDTIIAGAVLVSVPVTLLNLFCIYVIMVSKKLRQPRHFSVISSLFASAFQSMFVLPIYMQKVLEPNYQHEWLCDLYRFPYFFTQHIIKVSLLAGSIDRVVATRYPYRYPVLISKCSMLCVYVTLWLLTIIVDLLPFFLNYGKKTRELCFFIPTKEWGLSVIIMFDIVPFFAIIINYVVLWQIAASVTREIQTQKRVSAVNNAYLAQEPCESGGDVTTPSNKIKKEERRETIVDNNSQNSYNYLRENNHPSVNSHKSLSSMTSVDSSKSHKPIHPSASIQGGRRTTLKFAWEMKATRTSIIVCVAYAFCWLPMGIFYTIDHLCQGCLSATGSTKTVKTAKIVIKFICLTSSIFLPLAFCWRTDEFRLEVTRLFCKELYQKRKMEDVGTTVRRVSTPHHETVCAKDSTASISYISTNGF